MDKKIYELEMNLDLKNQYQHADKKSESSCKMSKSRKIIKKTPQKLDHKSKTLKITNFFKKLSHEQIQRVFLSSKNKQLKRSPEEETKIQQLYFEQRELQHEQEMLKKEIETLKSQEQMILEESGTYLKKLRHCQVIDLKLRYEIIRAQKGLPDLRRMETSYHDEKVTPEIKQILQRISIKQKILAKPNLEISLIQKTCLQKQLQSLQSQLEILKFQQQIYKERQAVFQREKVCKFAQMNWPLINKRYQTLELIGFGGYSQVYKALNLNTNDFQAVKLCSVAQMAQVSSEVYLKHLFRECETHKKLKHQNIVKLYEVVELDSVTYCMILQFCEGPELSKYLKSKGRLTENETKSIMFQIFETLYYLNNFSNKKIVHFDLKPQNIMFNQGLIKILDFGLNVLIEQQQSRVALTSAGMGTHAYLPPEIRHGDQNDRVLTSKVDVWSSGIIFYQLLFGKRPTTIWDLKDSQNSQQDFVSKEAIELIELCLKLNPAERITPEQSYFHEYFDKFPRKYVKKSVI